MAAGTAAEIGIAGTATAEVSSLWRGRRPATNISPESREYISPTGGLFHRAVPLSRSKGCTVMERDREQLEKKLDLCRRLSGAASDPTTSIRLAKIIEELEHSVRETEYLLSAS
jgi:hypothetical protein